MRATHVDYMHPGHLRVETGETYPAWSIGRGFHRKDALCVGPSSSMYGKLKRAGLPKWEGDA